MFAEAPPRDLPAVVWPLTRPISETVGTDTLNPSEYAMLADAIRGNEPSEWEKYAVFRDGTREAAVGLRVEVPGWTTYCEGESWCGH